MGYGKVRRRPSATQRRAGQLSDTLLLFAKTRERLARLTDDLRIALSLVVLDGLSYDEAASRLNISMTALLTRLAQAREAVAKMVADENQPKAVAAE